MILSKQILLLNGPMAIFKELIPSDLASGEMEMEQLLMLQKFRRTNQLRLVVFHSIYEGFIHFWGGDRRILFHQQWRQKLHQADSQVQRWPESVVSLLEHHPAYLKFCSADRDRDYFQILGNGRWKSTKTSGIIHPKRFFLVNSGAPWDDFKWVSRFSQEIRFFKWDHRAETLKRILSPNVWV